MLIASSTNTHCEQSQVSQHNQQDTPETKHAAEHAVLRRQQRSHHQVCAGIPFQSCQRRQSSARNYLDIMNRRLLLHGYAWFIYIISDLLLRYILDFYGPLILSTKIMWESKIFRSYCGIENRVTQKNYNHNRNPQ